MHSQLEMQQEVVQLQQAASLQMIRKPPQQAPLQAPKNPPKEAAYKMPKINKQIVVVQKVDNAKMRQQNLAG